MGRPPSPWGPSMEGLTWKKREVQGQASEEVLPEKVPAALGEEDRKGEVGLEGSWLREEGDWWSGVNLRMWKRSS